MTDSRLTHLNMDDLDGLLDASARETVQAHLDVCPRCREVAQTDRALVRALEALPQFAPSADFADRVMSRVAVPQAAAARSSTKLRVRFAGNRRAVLRVASATAILLVAMSASAWWTLANGDLLSSWGSQMLTAIDGWLWLGLRTMAANVAAQPWYGSVRDLLGSPGRLGLTLALLTVTYVAGVIALRRLVALPSRPMPHANW